MHGSRAGGLGSVIDKGAVALGDEEQALNLSRRVAREVVFESHDGRTRREISHPQRMAGLFWLTGRSSRDRT